MNRVLILDALQRSALATTRSLGAKSIAVFTADESLTALAGSSKFCTQYFTYPSPKSQPKQFIQTLSDIIQNHNIKILMPMTELTTQLLLLNKSAFPDVKIPFPALSTVNSLADKCQLMQMAESLGVSIPQTWYADDVKNLPCKLEELTYPLVLKPGKSWIFYQNQWQRAAVRIAKNIEEAQTILSSDWAFQAAPFMLQQYIDGEGAGLFAIYNQGKALTFFAHRRLREKPPSGGVSVLSESISISPALVEPSQKLLEAVNWHGVAMVEFKVAANGTPYLMEINTRFWGSLQLAVDAGVDFPYLLYKLACEENVEATSHYITGTKLRWLLGDFDNLYLTLRNYQLPISIKLSAIIKFILPTSGKTYHEVNRWSDLKPFWWELKQYFRDLKK
ncbi:ATP-grasp enzyme-like protein [hydrothermal vent metagenome]|uniref:ATP-grasp enzyme-like protein n=1 Tax=hydrothermal vent metagenome TaxID=652676 RepID=A0A3B0XDT2_9ZZZZ